MGGLMSRGTQGFWAYDATVCGAQRCGRRRRGLLACMVSVGAVSVAAGSASSSSFTAAGTALEAARQLVPPKPMLVEKAEFEGSKFWEEHDELLRTAWQEHGPLHGDLYRYGPAYEERYVHQELRRAAIDAREGRAEGRALGLFEELVPGVFASDKLFTEAFRRELLEELEHIEGSGIPRRRPNGMNRYGVILDQVGLEAALQGLADAFLKPLAAMLFPELVGAHDADEHYAFTVRYEPSGDTELAKHGDASVVTLNLCLGHDGWEGGALRFFESGGSGFYALPKGNASAGAGDVVFQPGLAVLHRGQHKHQALPLTSGERTNVIIWLHAQHGVVRVAPYPVHEQLTISQRWDQTRARAFEL